jgi:rhodanese-related sulfurtransferase
MGIPFFVTPQNLFGSLLGPNPPLLLDVRRSDIITASGHLIPGSVMIDQGDGPALLPGLDRSRAVIVACAHGHNRSQNMVAYLRSEGIAASVLQQGHDGWAAAGLPFVALEARGVRLGGTATIWVTRRRPKIDRVACPWLVSRFLDPRARFLFADPEWVIEVAQSVGGVAYDLPGGIFEHEGPLCSFDTLVQDFGLSSFQPLSRLATIIRAADTDSLALAPEAAGLLAVSLGLSARHGDDDHALLADGFRIYDGLLAWAMHAHAESHNWPRPAGTTEEALS